jgi:phosphoglycerate kinase
VQTVEQLSSRLGGLQGRRVLVRSDLNVPLDDGRIADDGRVRASVPTIADLRSRGAKVVVMAHLGRPKGQPDPADTLRPVSNRLGELLGATVTQASDTVGESAQEAVAAMSDGDVVVLENVRFNPGETSKDDTERMEFARQLAALGDAFVSDGFGVVHRKQASVYDLPKLLPAAAGELVLTEVRALRQLTDDPQRPYVVVLGGSKVSDKLGVIEHLLMKADRLLIGGGMVFTFLAAQGRQVGRSLLEADQLDVVRRYLTSAESAGVEIVLPTDVVVASEIATDAQATVVSVDAIPPDQIGLDIGPESAARFAAKLAEARTAFWNGPMGVFELAPFAAGTEAVARALASIDGLTVIGGGDSAAAIRQLGFRDDQFGHVSTGGGASLELLEGRSLPGLVVLED